MRLRPGLPGVGLGQEGDGQGGHPLHFLPHQLAHGLGLGFGALHNELVVDLEFRTRIMASLMMSAAVPWMGALRATRSPKERVLKLEDLISGIHRRRPQRVDTYPACLACSTTPSI